MPDISEDPILARWKAERDQIIREIETLERRLDGLSHSIFRRTEFLADDAA